MRYIIAPAMTRVIVRRRLEDEEAEVTFRIPGKPGKYDPMRAFLLSDASARALLDALREAYKDG